MSIAVRHVSKRFKDFIALDDISLDIPAGSLTALLGPSGSGKSTLLRVIVGLETPDSGDVSIQGALATGVPTQRRGVGFVFQHYAPFKHMTVWDNIAFGLSIRKRPKAEIRARVAELLALVQLEGFAERYPSQLSGGQRQRMALARALAVRPNVLLLDEPFGALDARVRRELRDWLHKLHEEVQVTTVLVTHDQEEAMEVADKIVVMNHGRVEQIGAPRDLYEYPANAFVISFVGQVNRIDDRYIRPHDIVILPHYSAATVEARIVRVLYLGFETRVELVRDDGQAVWVQMTREEAGRLDLREGQIVPVDLSHAHHFAYEQDGASSIEAVSAR